jgi:hypothetical protein
VVRCASSADVASAAEIEGEYGPDNVLHLNANILPAKR